MILGFRRRNNAEQLEDIYLFRPHLPHIDTSKHFEITVERGNLRVKNKNIHCLFGNLTPESFDKIYNDFNRHLNLDFEPAIVNKEVYSLTDDEKENLFETIVTSWIYFYTVNDLEVKVKRSDFTHPYMVDYVLWTMDKKYGIDTPISLMLGAKILRQNLTEYSNTVKGQRIRYDR